jgi:hypothetical protein
LLAAVALSVLCVALLLHPAEAGNNGSRRHPKPSPSPSPSPTPSPSPPSGEPVIAAAGDIACDPAIADFKGGAGTTTTCRQQYTSDLLVQSPLSAVLPLGDNQYDCGGYNAFMAAYDPSWGRVKAIVHPVPGNHEYTTGLGSDCSAINDAGGYFTYFGPAASDPSNGYYSFDVGSWHIIALNSNCIYVGGCGSGSLQEQWLKADLVAHPTACTLAYWHHPRFSSDLEHGNDATFDPFWQDLYAAGAEIVLNGHAHDFERFASQDPAQRADRLGIREFVVGTGGRNHYGFSSKTQPNSEVRNSDTFGVLKLVLHPTGYDWQFVPESGRTFTDSGTGSCH